MKDRPGACGTPRVVFLNPELGLDQPGLPMACAEEGRMAGGRRESGCQ